MLKILIVDDSPIKLGKIRELIQPYESAGKIAVEACASIGSAKRIITDKQFDLVILDIQLPQHDGESPKKEGGIELIRELRARSAFKKPHCIVGLTEYDDIFQTASPGFDDEFWCVVLFKNSDDDWADRLIRKIEYLLEAKSSSETGDIFSCDLGIITAIQSPEFDSVLRLGRWDKKVLPGESGSFFSSTFASAGKSLSVVATCAPQMGMPASAVAATKLIANFRPRYLAMVGISAGVKGGANLGDIVIADPCWDWGSGKRRVRGDGRVVLEPDPLPERLHPHVKTLFMDVQRDKELLLQVKNSFSGAKPTTDLALHIGPCASGASVLADGQTVGEIKEHSRKLLGVDMEAYGVMYAAANAPEPRPYAFSMKSICDFADNEKNDSLQQYSAHVSAALLQKIALKYF